MRRTFGFCYDPAALAQVIAHSVLFAIGFARWAPVFAMTPFLGGRLAPASVRTGLAVMMGTVPRRADRQYAVARVVISLSVILFSILWMVSD